MTRVVVTTVDRGLHFIEVEEDTEEAIKSVDRRIQGGVPLGIDLDANTEAKATRTKLTLLYPINVVSIEAELPS